MTRRLPVLKVMVVAALLLSGGAGLQAQADGDITARLDTAIAKLQSAPESRVRYTYFDRSHTENFDAKGRRSAELTELFEVTYLADLEYARLLEVNGKPLAGKALTQETARYDAAVRERTALDAKARAVIEHHAQKDAGIDLRALRRYHDTVAGHEVVDGRECLVIDAVPGTGGGSKTYRVWLDPEREQILRLDFLQVADEGEMLRGAAGTKTWIYRDDTPLVTHSRAEAIFATGGGRDRTRVVAEHSYSGFRKFSATATMMPAADGP